MNKFIQLVSDFNDQDLSLLFDDKQISVVSNKETIISFELPIGISAHSDFIKIFRIAVIDEIDILEEEYHVDNERLELLIKTKLCLQY